EVRLTWLGKEIGTQKPAEDYNKMPHPPVIFKDVFDFRVINSQWRDKSNEIVMVAEGLIGGKVVCVQKKKYAQRTTRIKLELDDRAVGVTADGSDFVPVRAVVVDHQGVPKVLASEHVTFIVDGDGELIEGPPQLNPMKAEFGIATALVRATTKDGLIRVRAFAAGLIPADELFIPTAPSPLPLLFDEKYANESLKRKTNIVVQLGGADTADADVQLLKQEIERLKLEAVSREQDLMDLRGRQEK
ncbi:MAG: hypothetical protein LBI05_01560, partial [Planctomycetaceae bacterium]|nr:hypothetical protein [Planctomycetaceae bacterium]